MRLPWHLVEMQRSVEKANTPLFYLTSRRFAIRKRSCIPIILNWRAIVNIDELIYLFLDNYMVLIVIIINNYLIYIYY